MLNEHDLRDWEKVDFKLIDKAMEKEQSVLASHSLLLQFALQAKDVYEKQTRRIPKLLKEY